MTVRRLLAFLLLGLTLLGCRELTVPLVEPEATTIPVLVIDHLGQPLAGVEIELSNLGWVELGESSSWYGQTSEAGILDAAVAPGTYIATVRGTEPPLSSWHQPELVLGPVGATIDARPFFYPGRVTIPDSMDPQEFMLELRTTIRLPFRTVWFVQRVDLGPGGEALIPLIPESEHLVELFDYNTRVRLADSVVPTPGDSLQFEWAPTEFQVRLTLAGEPLAQSTVEFIARVEGSRVVTETPGEASLFTFFGEPGPGVLEIDPGGSVPVPEFEEPFEFRAGEVTDIELGDHRVDMRFEDPDGREVFGCEVEVWKRNRFHHQMRSSSGASRLSVYLRPAQYAIEARHSDYSRSVIVVSVDSDTTLTFVMEPETP